MLGGFDGFGIGIMVEKSINPLPSSNFEANH